MKKYLLSMLFILLSMGIQAQYGQNISTKKSNNSFDLSKLTFGGNLGLQFGDYTAINIAPQIGYNLSQYINVGGGFSYTYFREKQDHGNLKISSNYLGFNLYTQIYPVQYLVFKIQPEINRMWRTYESKSAGQKYKEEKFIPVCLIGGGLRFGAVTAMIEYDVAQNKNSPYGSDLFYSLGYTFSF